MDVTQNDTGAFVLKDDSMAQSGAAVAYADAETVSGAVSAKLLTFKVGSVARTDTSAKNLFTIPKNAVPVFLAYWATAASDAATTATLSIGITGSATKFLNAADVKTTASGAGLVVPNGALALYSATSTSADSTVIGTYAETGTASTTGGPWHVLLAYYLP